MKYSVLMSVYKNDSPIFLKEALDSIYENQLKLPDEIVIVFDGPLTNELYNVLNEFKKSKKNIVKYVSQKENKGLGEALKIGTEYCTGDYIFRMDSDDISDKKRFLRQMEFIENHKDVDVVGTDIAEFDLNIKEKTRIRRCPENHNGIVRMCKKRNPMNHVSVCIKKKSLIEAGGYLSLPLLEDYYLWIRMISKGYKFANINETLVYVRTGDNFNKRRSSKERINGWKVLQDYMYNNKMITKIDSLMNMLYINVFVNTPPGLKKIIYTYMLRK